MKHYFQSKQVVKSKDFTLTLKSNMKKFIFLLLLFPLVQCSNDLAKQPNDLDTITSRTECEPGSYSIVHGRIVFEDVAAYIQTLYFLDCASESAIDDWSREFELETAGKAYRDFYALVCDDELDGEEFGNLKDEYEGKLSFTTVSSVVEFKPIVDELEEFCNLDGEFQVGETVIKIVGNKIINITDPETIDPSTVDDQTTTDTTDGVFVYNLYASVSFGCCPADDDAVNNWASNPVRRLKEEYKVTNLTEIEDLHNGSWAVTPLVRATATAKSQKRAGVWPVYWWNCNSQTLSHNFTISFTHNIYSPFTFPSPAYFTVGQGPSGPRCDWKVTKYFGGNTETVYARHRPADLFICITVVSQSFTNTTPNPDVTVNIDCP
jgi:hypothetical protein